MDAETELRIKIISDTQQALKANKGFGLSLGSIGTAAAAMSAAVVAALLAVVAGILLVGQAAFNAGQELLAFGAETAVAMNRVQGETGAADDKMEDLKKSSLELLAAGIPGGIKEISAALITVKQVTGTAGEELTELTAKALQFEEVFGTEVKESIRATDQAMIAFGETGGFIFDAMTTIVQRTGDPMNDLADTVQEYSPLFAQAGFNANQMFSILESGVEGGARGFDIVADAIKEANLSLIEGQDDVAEYFELMFAATGDSNEQLEDLNRTLDEQKKGLEKTEDALINAEGAYADIQKTVGELEKALGNARRELKELSQPNLAGMKDFDDQLFFLTQDSKKAQLALLNLEEDTPEFEAAQASLNAINKQIDQVSLERDIAIEPQLRAIAEAAKESEEPIVTFDEALGNIAAKKGEIAGLDAEFQAANEELEKTAEKILSLEEAQLAFVEGIEETEGKLGDLQTPVQEFLQKIAEGELSIAEALVEIQQRVGEIDDAVLQQNIIGSLGTQFEDMGVQAFLALDLTGEKLGEVDGALSASAELIKTTGDRWGDLKEKVFVALLPITEGPLALFNEGLVFLEELVTALMPSIKEFGGEFSERFGPAVVQVADAVFRIAEAMGLATEKTAIFDNIISLLSIPFVIILNLVTLTGIMFQAMASIVETMRKIFNRALGSIQSIIESLQKLVDLVPELPDLSDLGGSFSIPGFANGIENFGGGLAMVHQNELLVNLPQGTDVIPASQTQGAAGGAGITVNVDARGSNDPASIEAAGRRGGMEGVLAAQRARGMSNL